MDALLRHQSQQARWFLKLDIRHFFPSCTKAIVHVNLWNIYPMPLLDARERINLWDAMDKICFKDGVLPQGAVTSPTLSNLLMVHVDHEITKALAEKDHRLTYTRYADDILISHEYQFDPNEIIALLTPILNRSCFELKTEKTRFGSASGRNWNLGLMYNQNNEITIGHMNKQKLRAALFNYLTRIAAGEQIPFSETYRLQGQLSYLRSVEPEFYEAMQTKYETKFNCHLREVFKAALNP